MKKWLSRVKLIRPYQLIFLIWGLGLIAGFTILAVFTHTPGALARPHQWWPTQSHITTDPKQATLLVFLHPECSCSRATMGELDRLMPSIFKTIHVVAVISEIVPLSQKRKSELEEHFQKSHINVKFDVGGNEEKLFDAQTSGQTLLYDISGKLVFSGGLTPMRGHMGDSVGSDFILKFAAQPPIPREASTQVSSVYGCELRSPSSKVNP